MIALRLPKRALLGLVLIFAMSISLYAQNKQITGTVTDNAGKGIAGISITVKGGNIGTQTSATGSFTINVPSTATTLVFTGVGFELQEIVLNGRLTVNVSMAISNADIGEVVVIGYGSARKKDLTGSVISLKSKDFNTGAILAPDQLFQNKIAGLEVTNTSGQPGAASTIQIRGNSSIRASNNPLFVVDGVPLDGSSARPNISNDFGSTPSSNPLLFIDPNTIEQVDVLKDASSAAIYGARGANGVIVITTKKATAGAVKVDVGINYGVTAGYLRRFKILDASQYRAALAKYSVATTFDGGGNTDALKEITQSPLTQNYSLALSGGSDIGKIRATFLASHNQGFIKKTSLDKYFATFGGTYKFLDKRLTIDFNLIAGNYGEVLTSVGNTSGSQGNIVSSAVSWNPTQSFRKADGTYNFPQNGSGNPLAFNDAYNDKSSVNSFLASISAAYKLTKDLEYKFLYGINHGTGTRDYSLDGWIQGITNVSGLGVAAIATAKLSSQTFSHTLNYKTNLSKNLTLDALGGFEYFKSNFSGSGIVAREFNTNLTEANRTNILYTATFQNAKTQLPYSTFVNPTYEIQSYFARAVLNLSSKYLLTATIRADGSSKFGKNNKYGYFPSVGAKWNISSEEFLKNSKSISNLALRLSYGITGNQEFPAGSSQEQFALNSYNTAPQIINGNPDLKWETTNSVNVGVDFSFLKGRIYGSFDYYNKNTSDILFQTNAIQPAPNSISFINLKNANLINSGVELSLGFIAINKKDVGLDFNLNVSKNDNKVENFTDPNTGLDVVVNTGQINGQGVSGTLAQVITNNQPVNVFFLKPFLGFDAMGNQKIGDNPAFAGNPNPSVILGFSTSIRYKDFTFSINAGGAFDYLIYNNTATSVTNIAGIAQGRNIDLAAYNSAEGKASGVGASTRFLEKGDYFKLRNATIKYNIGNAGKYIKNLSAFVSGSNLFVLTKFTGFDPEVNIDKSNNGYPSRSIEYVPYPTPRSISFGLNFSL